MRCNKKFKGKKTKNISSNIKDYNFDFFYLFRVELFCTFQDASLRWLQALLGRLDTLSARPTCLFYSAQTDRCIQQSGHLLCAGFLNYVKNLWQKYLMFKFSNGTMLEKENDIHIKFMREKNMQQEGLKNVEWKNANSIMLRKEQVKL